MTTAIILACGIRKRQSWQPLPLVDLYDGPAWRILRLYGAPLIAAGGVFALSAKFGLQPAATFHATAYNQKLDRRRADQLREDPQLAAALVTAEPWRRVIYNGGALYRDVVHRILLVGRIAGTIAADAKIVACTGTQGRQLAALKAALEDLGK